MSRRTASSTDCSSSAPSPIAATRWLKYASCIHYMLWMCCTRFEFELHLACVDNQNQGADREVEDRRCASSEARRNRTAEHSQVPHLLHQHIVTSSILNISSAYRLLCALYHVFTSLVADTRCSCWRRRRSWRASTRAQRPARRSRSARATSTRCARSSWTRRARRACSPTTPPSTCADTAGPPNVLCVLYCALMNWGLMILVAHVLYTMSVCDHLTNAHALNIASGTVYSCISWTYSNYQYLYHWISTRRCLTSIWMAMFDEYINFKYIRIYTCTVHWITLKKVQFMSTYSTL